MQKGRKRNSQVDRMVVVVTTLVICGICVEAEEILEHQVCNTTYPDGSIPMD